MSTNHRLDCDLSASWGSESDDGRAAPQCGSSEEEGQHVVQYRAFMLKQQSSVNSLACHEETADEAQEAEAEEMEMMGCKFCTTNLACPRCAEAKRRRKEREAAELRTLSVSATAKPASKSSSESKLAAMRLPELRPLSQPLTANSNKPSSGIKLADMLRTETPLPEMRPLSRPPQPQPTKKLEFKSAVSSGATQKSAPTASMSTRLPELRPLSQQPGPAMKLQNKSTAQKSVSKDISLPKMRPLTVEEKMPKTLASKTPLKQRALPELLYYGSKTNTKTALVDVSVAQKESLALESGGAQIKYTSKALPELKPRAMAPTPVNLDAQRLDRMGAQFRSASKAQSAPLRSLLLGQSIKPLACDVGAGAGEQMRNVKCHLRSCHERYFNLLEENGLMSEVADQHAADNTVCFIFIVPVTSVLDAQITEPHSEQTVRVLRYHVVRIPQGLTLARIRDRTVLPTLLEEPGGEVEIEYREGDHYIGGHRVIPDDFFPHHIGHIRGLLDPDAGVMAAPEEAGEAEQPAEQQVEEVELPPVDEAQEPDTGSTEPPSGLPPPMDEGTQQLLYTQSRLAPVVRETLFTRSALKGVVDKLSMSYYKGALDLGESYQQLENALPVTLTLRTYDTSGLFERCSRQRLADISRLRPSRQLELQLHQTHHLALSDGTSMSDYSAPEMKQLRLETMASGLLELSFTSPAHAGQTTRLLCKLQATSDKQLGAAVGTYMTDNENVLLRFANGALENVLINHRSAMPYTANEGSLGLGHFFELCLDERARKAFAVPMKKLAFDTLLLKEGTLSKYTRKAKRYVVKKTRNVLSKAEAEKKRALALKLLPVRSGGGPLQNLMTQPKGVGQSSGQLSARLYDRKMQLRDAESVSGLALQRYTDPVVWYSVQGDNQLYDALQRTDNYYMELDVDQWRKLMFNANDVVSGSQLYYARGAGDDVYVLAFEGQGLKAVAKVSRHSTYYKQLK